MRSLDFNQRIMSETPTQILPASQPIASIVDRIATPFLLFSASLFSLLLFSLLFVLPRFTALSVASESLSPTEVQQYQLKLQADLISMEQKRDHLVLPLQNSEYTLLKQKRSALPTLSDIRSRLSDTATHIPDTKNSVHFSIIDFDADARTVKIEGDVSGVGLRSMTVLASFVDGVSQIPIVDHLERPSFTRVDDGKGNVHSPFTMTLTLKP